MKYRFLNFVLDVPNRELLHGTRSLPLSVRNFQVLRVLVENPGRVFTREDLMEQVWPGRVVTQNSLDQALSRVRRLLAEVTEAPCIETVYGKGIRFLPEVAVLEPEAAPALLPIPTAGATRTRRLLAIAAVAVVIGLPLFQWTINQDSGTSAFGASAGPVILMLPSAGSRGDSLAAGGFEAMLGELLDLSGVAQLRDSTPQAPDLPDEQYLARLWRLSPDMKVVTTRLDSGEGPARLHLEVLDRTRPAQVATLEAATVGDLVREASAWLAGALGRKEQAGELDALLGQDDYLLDSYMRGLASIAQGEIDRAATFFEACLAQEPHHPLARLQLARMRFRQGHPDDALAMLGSLASSTRQAGLQIEIAAMWGDILDTRGDFEGARRLFQDTLAEHDPSLHPQLADIRYNLSYTLSNLGRPEEALNELHLIEANLPTDRDPELLAHVYQRQGSLNLETGRSQLALEKARAALVLLDRLQDELGRAKTLSLMARIYTHQGRHAEAEQYLQEALVVAESSNYPLGIGATLNELIHVYLMQAKFSAAIEANERMRQIAIEIDYASLLQAARQHAIEIARSLGQWERAATALDEHLDMARSAGHRRWIVRNHELRIDFLLDQRLIESVGGLIEQVQAYIEDSGERRMQPALNLQKIRWQLLRDRVPESLELIAMTGRLANDFDDGETLLRLAEIHAGFLLETHRPQEALEVIDRERAGLPPTPEMLRLCARANAALERYTEGVECALKLRQRAFESWTVEDQQLLARLSKERPLASLP